MSLSKQFEQLPMFMRGRDLVGSLTGTADFPSQPLQQVMTRKVQEAQRPLGEGHGSGVYDAVAKEGVLSPVQLIHGVRGGKVMGQGHHRAAAAAHIETMTGQDKWVPVVHTEGREGTKHPYDNVNADPLDKLGAFADHRDFTQHTKAYGQDRGWLQKSEDATPKTKPPYVPKKTPPGRL